ncbi:MAG: RNA methylase [candidate division WS6 bacterium GW2011_GWC1_33_20]|uniref:RNA methylase n=1 Tax=candidate division WS6 bacterium GW2011_GWC1_33_20 TaxID=1619089 RepID=A0A0F9ZYU4_9BACT|nr:MAG: RNA methylase [candidate division WS6 bacterium GW2011_GWE2_33_157]KKP44101.1 MAG: RNA methylase [candidate division WS6 bacterium GW2011_GWC1_33_20]KKP45026.1 MAG: RNA methylase [candidate division WS6 bacterium GW2011_GWF1_33_233]KKP54497.1 MAG: RNA methylase [candidate division WS6 bacterium GW2011_WS6_33_547]KKP81853.1 MAG: RNA methylase [candidate division WS6 bacterium GW2011_GWD1_35_594]HBB64410.1 hypothetical protein [Patescibacteria group bacterium]
MKNTYILSILDGTEDFVLKELLEKFPNVEIQSQKSKEIVFNTEESKIEIFRKLYSPTHIQGDGKKLNLSKRNWRKSFVPAGINPSLAYIMCMIADLKEDDIVLDPFCGASVIPITALKYFNVKRVICSDISGEAISKSEFNFVSTGLEISKYRLYRSDINKLRINKRNIDKIISNLPFGIRVGNHKDNINSYIGLESLASRVLRKKGKIIILTQEKALVRKVFKKDIWKVKSIIRVNEGGLLPEIFEISRNY